MGCVHTDVFLAKLRSRVRAALRVLQLLPHPQDAARHPGHGARHHGPHLDGCRVDRLGTTDACGYESPCAARECQNRRIFSPELGRRKNHQRRQDAQDHSYRHREVAAVPLRVCEIITMFHGFLFLEGFSGSGLVLLRCSHSWPLSFMRTNPYRRMSPTRLDATQSHQNWPLLPLPSSSHS